MGEKSAGSIAWNVLTDWRCGSADRAHDGPLERSAERARRDRDALARQPVSGHRHPRPALGTDARVGRRPPPGTRGPLPGPAAVLPSQAAEPATPPSAPPPARRSGRRHPGSPGPGHVTIAPGSGHGGGGSTRCPNGRPEGPRASAPRDAKAAKRPSRWSSSSARAQAGRAGGGGPAELRRLEALLTRPAGRGSPGSRRLVGAGGPCPRRATTAWADRRRRRPRWRETGSSAGWA